jgi:general secretion pathway protein I
MKKQTRIEKQVGFTLIEILIALVIISISLTAALQATSVNIGGQQRLARKIKASIIAESALNQVSLSYQYSGQLQKSYQTDSFNTTWYWQINNIPSSCKGVEKLSVAILNKQNDAYSIYTLSNYRIKPSPLGAVA